MKKPYCSISVGILAQGRAWVAPWPFQQCSLWLGAKSQGSLSLHLLWVLVLTHSTWPFLSLPSVQFLYLQNGVSDTFLLELFWILEIAHSTIPHGEQVFSKQELMPPASVSTWALGLVDLRGSPAPNLSARCLSDSFLCLFLELQTLLQLVHYFLTLLMVFWS